MTLSWKTRALMVPLDEQLARLLAWAVLALLLFWLAFVLTRPFGATLGDFLTKPFEKGGLDFGTIGSSLVLAAVLVALVAYASYRHKRRDVEPLLGEAA